MTSRIALENLTGEALHQLYDRLEAAEAAAATGRELELRQRRAWSAAGLCPMCSYGNTGGLLCDDCFAAVRRLPGRERRQWRRYEPTVPGQPVMGHGYTPAQLLGIDIEESA